MKAFILITVSVLIVSCATTKSAPDYSSNELRSIFEQSQDSTSQTKTN